MATHVDQKLFAELEHYGAEDVRKCMQCGNCSAVCDHASEDYAFPRKQIRMAQLGLEDRLLSSLEPWLCYYCGECSEQCPRGAEPGEAMMGLRRWLTARYDFTGLSRLFYRSPVAEIVAIVVVAVATAVGFLGYGLSHGDIHTYDGPTAFLPSSAIHVFDWCMASVLAALLGANALRMWWYTTGSGEHGVKPPLASYVRQLPVLVTHFFTQRRFKECRKKQAWGVHLVLMASYLTMLTLIMGFLHYVQEGPQINWAVHAFGYVASMGLVGAVIYMLNARISRSLPQARRSHDSDWIFLAMLLLVTGTGILQHILHRVGADFGANVLYVIHLAFVVPMLVLEVPFSKWSHMAYRPLAVYFAEVKRDALAREMSTAAVRRAV
jgi:quinone-modifying oxidoreductase, subunit QmoC